MIRILVSLIAAAPILALAGCGAGDADAAGEQPAKVRIRARRTPTALVDPARTAAAAEDPRSDPSRFPRHVGALLAERRFEALDGLAGELRDDLRQTPDGTWWLELFYTGLMHGANALEATVESEEPYLALLEAWREAHPRSVTASIALARAHHHFAWEARGYGLAPDSEEAEALFRQRLALAAEILEALDAANDPESFRLRISVGMGLRRPKAELYELTWAGAAVAPRFAALYEATALALLPHWLGDTGEVERFAAEAADRLSVDEGDALYARLGIFVLGYYGTEFFERCDFSWPRLNRGCARLETRFPGRITNQHCRLAALAYDRAAARALFEKLGDEWTGDKAVVWGTRRRYDQWRAWAESDSASLHAAIAEGDLAALETLLVSGGGLNAPDLRGKTPLVVALAADRPEFVARLLEYGVDLNAPGGGGVTPLLWATRKGRADLVGLLLDHGAAPDWRDDSGANALEAAIEANSLAVVPVLIERGRVNPNTRLRGGRTPLQVASAQGSPAMVRLLIEHGADVNARTRRKETALHIAAQEGRAGAVAELLEEPSIDLDARSSAGWTPLLWAVDHGATDIVELLLEAGADPDLAAPGGWTPLHIAAHRGERESVKRLLAAGAAVNPRLDEDGRTPMAVADEGGHDRLARLLERAAGTP